MSGIFTAIGNACTDLVAKVDEDFLVKHNIRKHHCTHLTTPEALKIIKDDLKTFQTIPGGAGANVAHVVAALGGNAHFISKIAADTEGLNFKTHMEENGVICHFPPPSPAHLGSSQIPSLITPDGERTFVSYDGVAFTFSADDYDFDLIRKSDILYLDGYSYCSSYTGEGFVKAASENRLNGRKTIFNLGDLSILEANEKDVNTLMNECAGMICNYVEAKVIFNSEDIQTIIENMMSRFTIGALTNGADGAYVFADGETCHIPAEDISDLPAIDTNGAGDHFYG
jgi:sugar/nucleoside kinase (ribokinase family)